MARPDPPPTASGHLPRAPQTTVFASLCSAGALLALAVAVAFVVCGLWQAVEVVNGVTEVLRPMVAAASAAPRATPATDSVSPPAPTAADASRPRPTTAANGLGTAGPMLATATKAPRTGTSVTTFEAQAEASERVIPVGLEAALDDTETRLPLGQLPPSEYPRVKCEEIFVYIVTIAEGAPQQSAASIGVGKQGPARFRRPGERIGEWTVLAISDDSTGLNPDVWLQKDGVVCRAELAGNPSRVHQPPKPPPRRKARHRRR